MIVAEQHKYIDEELMDYTSELVYHPVVIYFRPTFYLKTQRYQCIQSRFYWYFYVDVEICLTLREEQIKPSWVVGWFLCLASSSKLYQACLQQFKEIGLSTRFWLKSQMMVHVILQFCGQILWKM